MRRRTDPNLEYIQIVERMEKLIAVSAVHEPARIVQMCRAADLHPRDFVTWPAQHFIRAAWACIEVAGIKVYPRLVWRAGLQLAFEDLKVPATSNSIYDQHDHTRDITADLSDRYVEAKRMSIATVIGRLARLCAQRRLTDQLLNAARRSMNKAWRVTQEQIDADLRTVADGNPARVVARNQRRFHAPGHIRTVERHGRPADGRGAAYGPARRGRTGMDGSMRPETGAAIDQ